MFPWGSLKIRLALVFIVVTLFASLSVVCLCGCGGGGGEPSLIKLSGTVMAPEGTSVAQAPSFLNRLASLFISVAEAQALTGKAVAGATVKAFIWPNVPPTTTTPIAITQTDNNGRYTLQLPANAAGKDIVLIAEKSVEGGTLRLSTIVADVPKEGKVGVDLDVATTLATEQIVYVAKNQNIQDFSANGISIIISEIREIVRQLTQLNLGAGAGDSPVPLNFGDGLRDVPLTSQIAQVVEQQQGNLPAPTGDVAIAKSIVQMLRDFGLTLVGIGDNEVLTIQKAVEEQQQVISNEVKLAEDFMERVDFPLRVLSALEGEPPGAYEEIDFGYLEQVDRTDNKTWKVTSKVSGETFGMVLTLTSQQPMEAFEFTPEAGVYTLTVRKQNDPSVQYDGQLKFTVDSQGIPTAIALNITIKDGKLSKPISFNGTVSGVVASGSTLEAPEYSKVSFSGTFSSQFGITQVDKLEVVTTVVGGDRVVQKITLTNLRVATQTSKPANLTLSGTFELEPTPTQWQDEWGDMMPKSGNLTATLEASDIKLRLSNAQVSDFVIEEGNPVPRRLTGQLNYTSSSLNFQGSITAFYEGLGASELSEQVKFTFSLRGDWKPTIGSPLGVSIATNSTSQTIRMDITLGQGEQKLEGNFTGNWKFVGDAPKISSGSLNLTHSPSNFKVQVNAQEGQPVTGTIKTAQGQTVAEIGEAENLGLPDLGKEMIVKYSDGTFETLRSILPRSRMSRR
ncbi:MAG: hypothetical protein ACK4I8_09225 [Armatimonadota bacterium]